MNGHLLPTDSGWVEDKALIADLSGVNAEITRYVLRYLDVDAQRAEPISADDEHGFGQRIIDVGRRVQQRAVWRASRTTSSGPVVEGDAVPPRASVPVRPQDADRGL